MRIQSVDLVAQTLRIDMRVAGVMQGAGLPAVTAAVGFVPEPVRIAFAFRLPVHFALDLDLRAGRARLAGAGVSLAEFTPVAPFEENVRLPVEVAVRQGPAEAAARQTVMLPLPTVIVPGYLNDLGEPDPEVLSIFERHGYRTRGDFPTAFWIAYPSRRLTLQDAARSLAAYVHDVVLPSTYAARINVVGYSLGGLMARWNIAFEAGWDRLVNRLVLLGVPNEGAVMAYVYAYYPAASLARKPAARSFLPTFPFWRSTPGARWMFPPDVQNPALAELNTHALPDGIRTYAFYGDRAPNPTGAGTYAGITGELPQVEYSYGPGDGIVLVGSALGLPINGGAGVPGLAGRFVQQVDLGPVGHLGLLRAGADKIIDALLDRFGAEPPRPVQPQ